MFLLMFIQADQRTDFALFESIVEGRQFLSQLTAYHYQEKGGDFEEYLDPSQLALYAELDWQGSRIPISSLAFPGSDRVDIFWEELPNLSVSKQGLVQGAGRVDAYQVDYQEMAGYIKKREDYYQRVKEELEAKGYEVDRAFLGSEDGEAIVYRRQESSEWEFYGHISPDCFE